MRNHSRLPAYRSSRLALLASAALLQGCGGADGSSAPVSVVTAPPATSSNPTPTPTGTPSPTSSPGELAEDARSNSAAAANADAAYRGGATGRGVKIAIIDSGITPDLAEFSGRIDGASADLAGSRGLVDTGGHGTLMASVALAARDGKGMHGLAYEATLVSLNVSDPNDCVSLTRCSILGQPLLRAFDAAIAAKVRVINFSFSIDQTSDVLLSAVRRAAAAGIVVVVSAGNNESGGRQPVLLARSFAEAAPGWVIIAGSHEASGAFNYASSNQAGDGADSAAYLTALGKGVNMTSRDGSVVSYDGTSAAAAAISGAVALVAQARPSLTGDQIVSLLLANATDAGSAGRDAVFGNGILNIAATFAALPPPG